MWPDSLQPWAPLAWRGDSAWSRLPRYCVAIAMVCLSAVLARVGRFLGDFESEHALLVFAIAISGWCGGAGPAALATVMATLIAGGFFTSPGGFLMGVSPYQDIALLFLIGEGMVLAWISGLRNMRKGDQAAGGRTVAKPTASGIDYRRIVESATGCVILLVDTHGRVRTWPRAGEEVTGFLKQEIVGMPLSLLDVDVATSGVAFRRSMEIARQSGSAALQTRCVRKGGSEFWADIVVGTVKNASGELDGFSVVLRDITARKQAEDLLEQRSRQLIEASRLKDEFLATVSHELRTPLNSILGWTQLFRAGKLDDAGRTHALETIEQSAKTQARLIEDLLDVSRIVTGKMRLEIRSVEMTEVIEAAVETIRPAADAKNIAIHLILEPVGCPVFGDPNRLQQVVWNLLSNAIKFTQQGGAVQILLHRRDSMLQVLVKDNGIGIKPDFLQHVFDAFRQADSSSTRSHKGLGLGLTIVRCLIELHGGTIRAESAGEGLGTTMEIMLPVASLPKSSPVISTLDPEHRPVAAIPIPYARLEVKDLRAVVVDDDPGARELISTVLSHNGVDVEAFGTASEGLEAIERLLPDVLISDIEMPEEDGYMFIQEVRALDADRGGRTPAIALTAYTRAEDRSRSLAAGFQMHLSKPVDAEELLNAILVLASQKKKGASHAQVTRN